MKVQEKGTYRLTEDYITRNSIALGKIPSGTVIEITQIDSDGHQVIGPELMDWAYWEMPVERVK